MLINVAIVHLLSLLWSILLPGSTVIFSSLLLIDTYFSCFAFMNNAAIVSFHMVPLLLSNSFLFVSLFLCFCQIHSLSFPCSALYLRDLTHTGCISQTPVSPGWLLGLARGKHWQERESRRQSASLRLSQMVSLLHLQLPLHRSSLVLASAQRLQLTPGLLQPHFFVSVARGGSGF